MPEKIKLAWFSDHNVSWQKALAFASLCAVSIAVISKYPLGEILGKRLARRVEFEVRNFLGKAPTLSPRLKIFAIDDETRENLGGTRLNDEQWSALVGHLKKKGAAEIFIVDALNDPGVSSGTLQDIITTATVRKSPIAHREESKFLHGKNQFNHWWKTPPSWFDLRKNWAYGSRVGGNQSRVGHSILLPSGDTPLFLRTSKTTVLPHWAILGKGELVLRNNQLHHQGKTVLDIRSDGTTPINYLPIREYVIQPLWDILYTPEQLSLPEGTSVVILPKMDSENVSIRNTPVGALPESLAGVSLLNSVLTGEYLRDWGGEVYISLLMCLVGMAFGMLFTGRLFWAVTLITGGTFALASLCSFSYFSTIIPWTLPLLGFLTSSITVFAEKSRIGEQKVREIRRSLEGLVDPQKLKQLIARKRELSLKPSSQELTVMFIDIVGFSITTKEKTAEDVFADLKTFLSKMAGTIHQHGGIIDKSTGDGLLAFFGYVAPGDTQNQDHADDAVLCAIALQKLGLKIASESGHTGSSINPIRIGINTGDTFVGDLGGERRIDFTIVGSGVNFAQRCETACEPFKILISERTKALLKRSELKNLPMVAKRIQIKHYDRLFPAWEIDPLPGKRNEIAKAVQKYRQTTGVERKEDRFDAENPIAVGLHPEILEAHVVNFSQSGLAFRSKGYFAKGSHITLSLTKDLIEENPNLPQMVNAEVRWGVPEAEGFLHGCLITDMSDEKKEALFQCFTQLQLSQKLKNAG